MAIKRVVKRSNEPEAITIGIAFDEFTAEKEAKNITTATIKNYKTTLTLFLNFHQLTEDTPVNDIKTNHIYKWINTMRLEGVKNTSINHYLRDIRAFLYWCMDDTRNYIEKHFKIEMVKVQEETPKTFTDEELKRLLEKPRRSETFVAWRTWTMINWVLGTGNRARTICNVKIADVDFKAKEITLRETKAKKVQIIPLSSSLAIALKDYIKLWRSGVDADAYLFPNIGEQQLTTHGLGDAFERYAKSREVYKYNIHGLRHTFAKKWVQGNGNLFVLQRVLGHSTLDMTRRYVNLFSEDLKEDYDEFSPLDNLKSNTKRTQKVKRNTEE